MTLWIITGILLVMLLVPIFTLILLYLIDQKQEQHAVLRNYPLLGRFRYIIEKIGPEMPQYLYNNDQGMQLFGDSKIRIF